MNRISRVIHLPASAGHGVRDDLRAAAAARFPGRIRGFTLVEVMVALVIISVALVTLLATHVQSTKSYADAKIMAVSSMLAGRKLAEIQSGEYPEPGEDSGMFEDNENYRWRVAVAPTDLEELREVTVEVALAPSGENEEETAVGGVTVLTYVAQLRTEEEDEESGGLPSAG